MQSNKRGSLLVFAFANTFEVGGKIIFYTGYILYAQFFSTGSDTLMGGLMRGARAGMRPCRWGDELVAQLDDFNGETVESGFFDRLAF